MHIHDNGGRSKDIGIEFENRLNIDIECILNIIRTDSGKFVLSVLVLIVVTIHRIEWNAR